MKSCCRDFPVLLMCRVLEVSRSGYYAWLKRKPSARAIENSRLAVAIRAAHERSRETYGPLRLRPELAADGYRAGLGRIKRIRNELGLRCKQSRKFKATTNSKHNLAVAENRLQQNFATAKPNEVWVTDLTYIETGEGWLYLAGIKDLYTCEIVGYAMGPRMTQELVGQALVRAVKLKRPAPGLLHHSDRGSQYCSYSYQGLLRQFKMEVSMSRKGNCYDNAPMESFWGSLKQELVHQQRYATREKAMAEITEYIEIFYNRQRRHSKLGYLSPVAFAQRA
jgi:putative transposase